MAHVLKGAIAAAVTPLCDDGRQLDENVFGPMLRFLADGGIDGVLACGTTGEGILLSVKERRRAAEWFVAERPGGLLVAVHAGAQTTAETIELATHAKAIGADAVAVIAPPYFPLDDGALLEHFRAAAAACDPLPFYVYEFAARSGYAIPIGVVEHLRALAPNLAGMKVSDAPWSAVEPYALEGLDLFVGSEPLVLESLERGGAGSVSGLAAAFPEIVAELVHAQSPEAAAAVLTLRDRLTPIPFHAALKEILAARGVPIRPDVRAPLRGLTRLEREVAFGAARAVGTLDGGEA
jgi:dihydrodipicolinate synthase/N-acetylneuraminate lyase